MQRHIEFPTEWLKKALEKIVEPPRRGDSVVVGPVRDVDLATTAHDAEHGGVRVRLDGRVRSESDHAASALGIERERNTGGAPYYGARSLLLHFGHDGELLCAAKTELFRRVVVARPPLRGEALLFSEGEPLADLRPRVDPIQRWRHPPLENLIVVGRVRRQGAGVGLALASGAGRLANEGEVRPRAEE